MDTYEDRIRVLLQGVVNLNESDTVSLAFIIIHTSLIFSEVKNSDDLSERFLPQIEAVLRLLERKTQKSLGTLITELDVLYS
jgi:hypothetical protein